MNKDNQISVNSEGVPMKPKSTSTDWWSVISVIVSAALVLVGVAYGSYLVYQKNQSTKIKDTGVKEIKKDIGKNAIIRYDLDVVSENGLDQLSDEIVVANDTTCVQLGAKGYFIPQKSGMLQLFFNDNMFGDNAGSYQVSINGTKILVSGGSQQGVNYGYVKAGERYAYSAAGLVQFNWSILDNGAYNTSFGSMATPDGVTYPWDNQNVPTDANLAGDDFICPGLLSLSLVGQIR